MVKLEKREQERSRKDLKWEVANGVSCAYRTSWPGPNGGMSETAYEQGATSQ